MIKNSILFLLLVASAHAELPYQNVQTIQGNDEYLDSKVDSVKTTVNALSGESTSGVIDVAHGGTAATTIAGARASLGVPSTLGAGASGNWDINITGNAATANSATSAGSASVVPQSGVNLSTVTANHVLKSGDTMSGQLTSLSSMTATYFVGNGSQLTAVSVNLSTVTAALADKISGTGVRYSTDTVSVSLIDLSTVTSALAGKVSIAGDTMLGQLTVSSLTVNGSIGAKIDYNVTVGSLTLGGITKTEWPSGELLKEFFLTTFSTDSGTGYTLMLTTPPVENISTKTFTVANGASVVISTYISQVGLPNMTAINSGAWYLNYRADSNRAGYMSSVVNIYHLAGTYNNLFTFPNTTINQTVPYDWSSKAVVVSTSILTSDRLMLVRTFTCTTNPSCTLNLYKGNGYYNDLDMPAIIASAVNFVPTSGSVVKVDLGNFGLTTSSNISANAYYGSGANLTGVIPSSATGTYLLYVASATYATTAGAASSNVLKAGDNMTGQLTTASTLTVQGTNFSVGGSTIVANAGWVGIGTNTPSSGNRPMLDVKGMVKIGNDDNPLQLYTVGNASYQSCSGYLCSLNYDSNYPMALNSVGTGNIIMASAGGNVVIGADTTPTSKLEVVGSEVISSTLTVQGANFSVGGSAFYITDGAVTISSATGLGKLSVGTGAAYYKAYFSADNTLRGTLRVGSNGATTGIFLGGGTSDTYGMEEWYDGNTGAVYFDNQGDIAGGSTHFRNRVLGTPLNTLTLSGTGNVGIGTGSPSTKLHVQDGVILSSTTAGFGVFTGYGSSGGCLMLRDSDNAGWTKCKVDGGAMTCATDADGVCD